MPKVHILPPDVISKIAAGEVIERPASVIKELVENAIDAGSTSIELHLQDAGKTLIRLKDSGSGIDRDDIETIFIRHSTSKIQTADDLFDIHSLGFRGEALYSVAAIADILLRSKTKHQDSGWEIHMRGGEKINLKPVAMSDGTEIEVKELFFNTPARKKFLKANATELNQIIHTVLPYALLYPSCRFLFTHENRTPIDLKPQETFVERIAEALHLSPQHLIETKEEFPEHLFAAHMILGDINIARPRRDLQFIFINGRPVQSKLISFHLNEVYRLILPPNSAPFFVLYLTIPAQHLDVNIHPTKREVKIKDEHLLMPLLRHLVEKTLMAGGKMREVKDASSDPGTQIFKEEAKSIVRALSQVTSQEKSSTHYTPADPQPAPVAELAAPTEAYTFPQEKYTQMSAFPTQNSENLQTKLSRGRYIGSFINKFLLFETDRSLLIFDQHAAQERITFEYLIVQMQKGKLEVQNLLTPDLIKVTPAEMLIWEEGKAQLEAMGLSSTQFNAETIAIHSYPVLIKDPSRAVRELLAGGDLARADHATLARRACRASIMSGDSLQPQQAEYMRKELLQCRDPYTCPHGRPTIIELKESFLDRQFFRT